MKKRWYQMTLLFAAVAFVLERSFSSSAHVTTSLTNLQTVFQVILIGIESISFGLGITFAMFGKEVVTQMTDSNKKQGYLLYGSIVWLLVAWLPYNTLLNAVGTGNVTGFLAISYLFQLSLICSGLIVAYSFIHPFIASQSANK